jgi:hypothetical protein
MFQAGFLQQLLDFCDLLGEGCILGTNLWAQVLDTCVK